jgi:hypothetical protein
MAGLTAEATAFRRFSVSLWLEESVCGCSPSFARLQPVSDTAVDVQTIAVISQRMARRDITCFIVALLNGVCRCINLSAHFMIPVPLHFDSLHFNAFRER